MIDVVCFCGRYYRFTGDIGVCPSCGEYTSFARVSPEEEQQMRRELELLLDQCSSDEASLKRARRPGLDRDR